MGNLDLIFVFNGGLWIKIIYGTDYTNKAEASQYAVECYNDHAKKQIKEWYDAKKADPASVLADFNADEHWGLRDMIVFETIIRQKQR